MALTVTVNDYYKLDPTPRKKVLADVTFDSSYPTGGEVIAPADFGPAVDATQILYIGPAVNAGYVIEHVPSTGKLKAYRADYDAVGDGPLAEVPNTTNLASVTVRIEATTR